MSRYLRRIPRNKRVIAMCVVIVAALFVTTVVFNLYAGGWETISSLAPTGNVPGAQGYPYVKCEYSQTPWTRHGVLTYTGPTSHGVTQYDQYNAFISGIGIYDLLSNGAGKPDSTYIPDHQVIIGAPVHFVYNMRGELIETKDPHDHIDEYVVTQNGVTYYFEHHLYGFTVDFRTSAATYGPPAGSGSEIPTINMWATVEFDINPWQLVPPPDNKTYTMPDGSELIYVDGWAGIMSAWIGQTPSIGPVSGSLSDDNGGSCTSSDPPGPVPLEYVDTQGVYAGYAFKDVGIAKVPQQVLITVHGGTFKLGGHNNYAGGLGWVTSVQPVNYRYYARLVVDVVQRRGFTLETGNLPEKADTTDSVGEVNDFWSTLFKGLGAAFSTGLIMIVGSIVIVLVFWKVLPAYLNSRGSRRK